MTTNPRPKRTYEQTLTCVDGFRVGHAERRQALTGVTLVLCPEGAVGGLTIRGGAVGGRQFPALDPQHVVDKIQGVLLCGGSAYGLAAADGVMTVLERHGIGFDAQGDLVPIVPSAVIFDLKVGDGTVRPDATLGAAATESALSEAGTAPVTQGCVGVGIGASVGKIFGIQCATKGGLGSAGMRLPAAPDQPDGLHIGALAVVNAFGDVRDPCSGQILAGARQGPSATAFLDTWEVAASGVLPTHFDEPVESSPPLPAGPQNTTLGVVATNARLSALEANLVARLAGDALARTLSPGGTRFDGDVVFALSGGQVEADPHRVGLLCREALEQAVLRAVRLAEPLGGLPASRDLVPAP